MTTWLNDDEQRAWRAWLDVQRLLEERLGRQLAEDSGLSVADYEIFVRLSEAPERSLRMSELAARCVQSRSRLTHGVSRLEERGWVRRGATEGDRRGVVCSLTDAGFAVLRDAAPGHVAQVRADFMDLLSPDEVETLAAALTRIRDHLAD